MPKYSAMMAYRGCERKVPRILDLTNRRTWEVSCTFRPT